MATISIRKKPTEMGVGGPSAPPLNEAAKVPNRGNPGGPKYPTPRTRSVAKVPRPKTTRSVGGAQPPEQVSHRETAASPPGVPTTGTGITPAMPPPTPSTQAAKVDAEELYNRETAHLNQGIYNAALQYGDPTTLAQFRNFGPTVANPNSRLENILRTEQEGLKNVGISANRGNTFFSSLRLGNQQRVTEVASRARTDAYNRFQEAYSKYTTGLATARARLEEAIRNAEAQNIENSLSQPPEPTGITPKPQVKSSTKAKSVKKAPNKLGKATGKITSTKAVTKNKPPVKKKK